MISTCTQSIKRLSREEYAACEKLPGFEWRAYGMCGLVDSCYVKISEHDITYGCRTDERMSTFLAIFDFLRQHGVMAKLDGPERVMYSTVLKAEIDMHAFATRHGLPYKEMIHVRMQDASVVFRHTGCVITSKYEHGVEEAEARAREMMAQPQ